MNQKNNEPKKAIIQQWKMPATQLPIKYSDVMAEINGWEIKNGSKWSKYLYQLQDHLSKAVISGELKARDNITGIYINPGAEAYSDGWIDLQDFCNWANKAGLIGVPDDALKLAAAFGLPREAYLSESHQAFNLKTQIPAPEPQPAPVMAVGASGGMNWTLNKPQRFQGYSKPLYDLLKAAHIAGQPSPKARDVLDKWKENPPPDIATVTDNGLKYYDAKGNTKPADLEAIRKAIDRMIR